MDLSLKIVGHPLNNSLRTKSRQSLRLLGLCSQISKGQQTSPIVFPEKRSRGRTSTPAKNSKGDKPKKVANEEHRIDVGDEKSDLLGYDVLIGKLALDMRKLSKNGDSPSLSETTNQEAVDAKLTSKALIWGTELLSLEDVISVRDNDFLLAKSFGCCYKHPSKSTRAPQQEGRFDFLDIQPLKSRMFLTRFDCMRVEPHCGDPKVSYYSGLRYFTLHSYPYRKASLGLSCFPKKGRSRHDFRFLASTSEDAIQWVSAFADQQCYVNCLPHPLKQTSDSLANEFPPESYIRCKTPPRMLVILNPRSGRGRSSKLYHGYVEPIFKLAGFQLEVVKTNSAGHARKLASSVDLSSCPDGIICVGGDGLVNEVLNGLLSRSNQKEAISVPIGIIPAGSDNSLVWTVLGVRDPISAAISIVKSGLTAIDIFAVEWIKSGVIHFGTTVTYFGFVGDVLELSERYQKRFGPLRYFVAGFLKFFCLPKYTYEVEYLPAAVSKQNNEQKEGKGVSDGEVIDMTELYTDIMTRSSKEGLPRASSLSTIDSIMTPSRLSDAADVDTTEPSEYVRAIDAKSKRLSSSGRNNNNNKAEPEEVMHTTQNRARTRSKSRTEKGWSGLTITTNENTRSSWANINDEDISSTLSDPGPIWDSEPRWDTEPNRDVENHTERSGLNEGLNMQNDLKTQDQWMTTKGHFLGVLVCNHSCKTVQSLSSQVIAPKAEHDDKNMDLLLVHGNGRFRLLRFLLLLQMGKHLSLPYVEYLKVKSVKVKPGKRSHSGCGIDGELFAVNEPVMCSLLPDQCRLIGHPNGKL